MFSRTGVGRYLLGGVALGALLTGGALEAQERTLTSSRQLQGSEPMRVEVEAGAGELHVEPLDEQDLLYQMELRYDERRATPLTEFDSASRTLRLGLRGRQGHSGRGREASNTEVELTREVPIDLALRFGAGEASFDLGGLRVRRLSVETGASETMLRVDEPNRERATLVEMKAGASEFEAAGLGNLRAERYLFEGGVGMATLDFGGVWDADATAEIRMGMGALVLRFPRSVGVRIDRSAFLSRFEGDGFSRRDGQEVSDNWDSARHHLTIDLDAALGSVEVHWIDD